MSTDAKGKPLWGKHELVQSPEGQLPYVDSRFEAAARALASSRGVPEMTHTDQNLIKGLNDQMIDRASILFAVAGRENGSKPGLPQGFYARRQSGESWAGESIVIQEVAIVDQTWAVSPRQPWTAM